jgi:protein SCO1/2
MNLRRYLSFAILLGIFGVVFIGALVGSMKPGQPTYTGSVMNPPIPVVDFSLSDQKGNPFRMAEQKGQVVLMFFGFTYCTEACPATLTTFRKLRTQLGERAAQVQMVLVTIDPERDTTQRLQEYLSNFGPGIVGLTGTEQDLSPVWKAYGIYRNKLADGDFEHTSLVFVIDRQNRLRLTFPYDLLASDMLKDVEQILKEP